MLDQFRTFNSFWPFSMAIGAIVVATSAFAQVDPHLQSLIDAGQFTEASELLQTEVIDPAAPTTSHAAIQLEILRRTRDEFPWNDDDILRRIRAGIPDATQADIDRWRDEGDLQARVIDGERRYFRGAVGNLYRFNDEARSRRTETPASRAPFDVPALLVEVLRRSDATGEAEVYPVKHRVRYELAVREGHPRLKAGAKVRAWLPFPQEYRQQRGVKLLSSDPPVTKISDPSSPQRTIYFAQTVTDPDQAPRFRAEMEFITSAYCPRLDPEQVEPYDVEGAIYREYTAPRPPHIMLTADVRQLAEEIVGEETNPLHKAVRIFRWVSANIPWCSEMEYSIIPSLSAKGLAARRGDCGVQGMTFITLCRAAGIPARWQSGWQTKPGHWNMHDWSEFYIEPWGWLPADASWGVQDHPDPRVQNYLCGHLDPYRMIVNLDYAQQLDPPKTSFRSEPNDFQRGEIEIDGHNLYFDEWDYRFDVETVPLVTTTGR